MKSILVTGDVVRDCHLYGGVKTEAASFSEPGTIYAERLGGAALTHDLIHSAANDKGMAWDAKKSKWDAENAARQKAGKALQPRPDDLEEVRPVPAYETLLDLDIPHLEQTLPKHLRSYGVWSDKPMKAGEKKARLAGGLSFRVWPDRTAPEERHLPEERRSAEACDGVDPDRRRRHPLPPRGDQERLAGSVCRR